MPLQLCRPCRHGTVLDNAESGCSLILNGGRDRKMRLLCFLPFLLSLLSVPNSALAQENDSTLFRQVRVLDGAGSAFVGDVLVRGESIEEVGASLDAGEADVIEGDGLWLTPGLIDVHTHYGTFLLPYSSNEGEGSDVTEQAHPDVGNTWIEHAVRPADPAFSYALSAGVTTVQVLPGSSALIAGRSIVVHTSPGVTITDITVDGSPRGLKLACGANPASRASEDRSFPNSRQGQVAFLREALSRAMKLGESGLRPTQLPQDQNGLESDKAKSAALLAISRADLPVHLHCYRAEDIFNWVTLLREFGVSRITVHHAAEAYKIAPFLVEQNVCVALWPDWWGFKREAEDAIFASAAIIDKLGGCVAMHSDIPVLGSLLNMEVAKAIAGGKRAGIDIAPERAFRWITENAARVLGIDGRRGTVQKGKAADLVLWTDNPLSIYSEPLRVYINGRVVFERELGKVASDFELSAIQEPAK